MPAQYIYNVNGPTAVASNVDLSARVRAYRTEATVNAEEGSVAISTFIVDDEIGSPYINITGFRNFRWKESSEGSNSRIIFDGYTADRVISRGPFRVQSSKQWAVNCADLNSILQRRIMRGSDANRPAETDVARIQWALATSELNLLTDSTYVSTSNPVAMDAVDYRNQRVADIVDDCAQQSGKNYFLILNELFDPPRYGLFYDRPASQTYSSSVRLTNVLADIDSTTTYAVFNDDLQLTRDPSRVYSGVIVSYTGGDQYVVDASIDDAFVRRDTIAPSWNVKTAAKAQARGLRYIQDIGTEEDRITMSYLVPLARVNRLKEGHSFQVKFSHLPGYTDWTWVRALKRTVLAISEEFYKVTIEASPTSQTTNSCSSALSGLSMYDSGMISGGPPCSVSPSSPSLYPSVVLDFMVMATDNTCIGPPIVSPNLTISGFTEAQKYQGAPAACEHSLLGVGYKALTGGSPGSFSYNYTGNGCETFRVIGINIPTAAAAPVQVAQQDNSGSTVTLGATPTPGNLLVMFRSVETNNWTATPGTGWTQIGTQVDAHVGISNHKMDVWVHCVEAGDGTTYGNGDASLTHWSFLSEWAIT